MNARVFSYFCVSMFVWSVILSGCGSRQSYDKNHYVLSTTRQSKPAESRTESILEVRRFTVDSAFAGKGLVYRTGEFEYDSDFYNEFLVSPSAMITEKTRNWLAGSGLYTQVLDVGSQIDPTHSIEGNVTKLYGDLRDESSRHATMEIRFFLLKVDAGGEPVPVFGKTYQSSVDIESKGPQGMVEALDRCLANILSNLERDLTKTAFSVGQ